MYANESNSNKKDKEYEKTVNNFGKETIKKVENRSKMFGSTVNQVASSMGCGNNIEGNISNLNKIVTELDPSNVDFTTKKRFFFNPAKKYFQKIKSEKANIELLIENLNKEKEVLKRDNITLELEITNLEEIIKQINLEYENGIKLKNEINENLEKMQDENKEKYYIQNVINPLEKKLFDLKQMAIIKEQSILAIEIICRNNKEIIRNLEKIQNVTMEALNTAIIVANSLNNQKRVLDKTKELNVFDNFYQTINEAEKQNKTKFPEIENKVIELKKIEEE